MLNAEAYEQLKKSCEKELKKANRDIDYHEEELKHAMAIKTIWSEKAEQIKEYEEEHNNALK